MKSYSTPGRRAAFSGLTIVMTGLAIAGVIDQQRHLFVVEEVIDGDTIRITWHGHDQLVQLAGVDAPELHKGIAGEPGAQAARDFLRRRILHQEVWIEELDRGAPRDHKGRLLCWVWLDHDNVCYDLVASGLARFSGAAEAPHRDALVALQDSARHRGRGVWSSRPAQLLTGRARVDNVYRRLKEQAERDSYGYIAP